MPKVIIAGSRSINAYSVVEFAVDAYPLTINEVVSGAAGGVDRLGEHWAERNGVPVKRFPADWNKYGKSAGYKRNIEMAQYADALVAVWDGKSRGTAHMIDIATQYKLDVYVSKVR